MNNKKHLKGKAILAMLILLLLVLCGKGGNIAKADNGSGTTQTTVKSMGNDKLIRGKVYTFSKDNAYLFSKSYKYSFSNNAQTYGTFSLAGTACALDCNDNKNGVTSISIPEGHIQIKYKYNSQLLNAPVNTWHLVNDEISNIDIYKISSNIKKGAIILQSSIDHKNWHNISVQTNVFANTPVQNGVLYETTDIEMINGCYYRLLVIYELEKKTGTSSIIGIIPKDDMEYKRIAEIYEFYAVNVNEHIEEMTSNTKHFSMGKKTLAEDFASYTGQKPIVDGDLHYGWDLGEFFVSGYTSTAENGTTPIFLKNVGDVVTLWFNLKQDINALNNESNLSITADTDGYDERFETRKQDFGRGMLIIRYTDHENKTHEPIYYKDFLEANTSMGANTRVQLFEEGDYEVTLDYEITRSQLISKTQHYYISFSFSVRNANCMVYPIDIVTGAELTNSSVTPNGFRLDLARSRYLKIFIRKEIWSEGADGLTEDTRLNTAAKDGNQYVDEGIYIITVRNIYTGLETTKKIYVGTNRILMAYMNSDYSIAQIQRLVEQGATIYEDGTIIMPTKAPEVTPVTLALDSDTSENIESSGSRMMTGEVVETTIPEKEQSTADPSTTVHVAYVKAGNNDIIVILLSILVLIGFVMIIYQRKQLGKEKRK